MASNQCAWDEERKKERKKEELGLTCRRNEQNKEWAKQEKKKVGVGGKVGTCVSFSFSLFFIFFFCIFVCMLPIATFFECGYRLNL